MRAPGAFRRSNLSLSRWRLRTCAQSRSRPPSHVCFHTRQAFGVSFPSSSSCVHTTLPSLTRLIVTRHRRCRTRTRACGCSPWLTGAAGRARSRRLSPLCSLQPAIAIPSTLCSTRLERTAYAGSAARGPMSSGGWKRCRGVGRTAWTEARRGAIVERWTFWQSPCDHW